VLLYWTGRRLAEEWDRGIQNVSSEAIAAGIAKRFAFTELTADEAAAADTVGGVSKAFR
jgi:hypothetical protein